MLNRVSERLTSDLVDQELYLRFPSNLFDMRLDSTLPV